MEVRPIDANELIRKFNDGESDTEQERSANQVARYLIRHSPTIDPETLPIVKQLRARNKRCIKGSEYKQGKYCSACGRPLTDEAWAELQKRLEGMIE